nr:unnamed protein product [Callosobruchus chinensis]
MEISKQLSSCKHGIKGLKAIRHYFNEFSDFTVQFNRLFSWQVLLLSLNCSLTLLFIFGVEVLQFRINLQESSGTGIRLLINKICFITYSLVGPLAVMLCCDSAINESRNIVKICYTLEQNETYTEEEKQELKSIVDQFTSDPPKFTAAGFFEINRSNILSFFSATATYLIVIIQMKSL